MCQSCFQNQVSPIHAIHYHTKISFFYCISYCLYADICCFCQFNPKLRFKVQRSCMVFLSGRLYAHPDYCGKHCIIEYSSSSTSHHYYHHFHLDISVHQEFLEKKFKASLKIPHYREYGHPEEHIQLKNEEFDGHIWDAPSSSFHFVVTLLCDHHLFICIELGTNAIPACG